MIGCWEREAKYYDTSSGVYSKIVYIEYKSKQIDNWFHMALHFEPGLVMHLNTDIKPAVIKFITVSYSEPQRKYWGNERDLDVEQEVVIASWE